MVGRNNRRSISAITLVFVFLVITTPGLTASKNARPSVAVVNYPLKYFAERIAGGSVKVVFPIPSDGDPALWTPEPRGVLAFQSTDLILLNGATYSKWLDKVTLSRSKFVNTSRAFREQYIKVRNLTTHAHGPGGEHAHAGMAFTTWIDFQLAVGQAKAIRDALKRLVPEEKERFEANFSALKDDLMALDRRVGEIVEGKQNQLLVTSHPVLLAFNNLTHTHGPGGEHAHAGMAFTTWIDFQLAVGQAKAIRDALKRLVPEEKERFEANFSALKDDLMALDRRVGEIVEGKQNQLLVASHPVYDYFARRYGLNVQSVLWEPKDFPSAKQWAELRTILKEHPAKWMIWEGKPNPKSVASLKSMGVDSLVFDPSGNSPEKGDFLSVMRQNIENLRAAF